MKRIFAVLVVLAMVFGVVLVANAEDTEFCGIAINAVDAITINGKTATMKSVKPNEPADADGNVANNQGYFAFDQSVLGDGAFSIEFDYNLITNNDKGNAFNFEGHTTGGWFVVNIPAGSHARLEGTAGGAWKLLIDGAETQSGTLDGAWDRPFKVGFTNQKPGDFEATISNLVVNDKNAATGDVTAIIALVAVLAGGVLVFSKKH